jgi:fucose 4-O-acetylase-like acetyltransferase
MTATASTRPTPETASPATSGASDAVPASERDPYFDNVKFLTIVLVVVGHTWAQFNVSGVEDAAYLVVYGFHMPLFVFVSGYFSRGYARSTNKFRGLIPTVVAPYVIFTLLYRAQVYFGQGHHFPVGDWLAPQFVTWFLFALVGWRLSTPIWQHLRYPVATAVVVTVVLGGWDATSDGSVSRMIGLLPFFVLGLTIDRDRFGALHRRARWWMGVPVLLGAFAAFFFLVVGTIDDTVTRLLLWQDNYEQMKLSFLEGVTGRLVAMGVAIVLGAAFLALAPHRRTWFTTMGTRTMYVFLLHGFVIKFFDYTKLVDKPMVQSSAGVVLTTLAAVALAVVLATGPVRRATHRLVEPQVDRLLARTAK